MELLTFAHRGEAQEFIKHFGAKPVDGENYLYLAAEQSLMLLLTGEGIYEVFSRLGPVIGCRNISSITNIGVAGSLDGKAAKTGEVLSIRTVYGKAHEPLFHSYTSSDPNAKFDIITAMDRVLDSKAAEELSLFAPLTDREAWAIGKLGHDYKIPCQYLKLVSDMAGQGTNCLDIKERALEFSASLLEAFLARREESIGTKPEAKLPLPSLPPFPMSFSQKARYLKLANACSRLEGFNLNEFEKSFASTKNSLGQKAFANQFLDELELKLNPIKKDIKERFETLARPVSSIGGKVLMDKAFEKKKFTLQMEVNDQQNLDNLSEALKRLKFKDFLEVWDGPQDV